jgi:hypothetical protein
MDKEGQHAVHAAVGDFISKCTARLHNKERTGQSLEGFANYVASHFARTPLQQLDQPDLLGQPANHNPVEPSQDVLLAVTDLEHDDNDCLSDLQDMQPTLGSLIVLAVFNPDNGGDSSRISAKFVQSASLLGPEVLESMLVYWKPDSKNCIQELQDILVKKLTKPESRVNLVLLSPTYDIISKCAPLLSSRIKHVYIYSGQNNLRGINDEELACLAALVDQQPDATLTDVNRCKLFQDEKKANFLNCLPELKQHLSPTAQAACDWFQELFNAPNIAPHGKTLFQLKTKGLSPDEVQALEEKVTEFRQAAKPVYKRSICEYARLLKSSELWPHVASYKISTVTALAEEDRPLDGPLCDSLLVLLLKPELLEKACVTVARGDWWRVRTPRGDRYSLVSSVEPELGQLYENVVRLTNSGRCFQHIVQPGQEERLIAVCQELLYPIASKSHAIAFCPPPQNQA